jgi:NADPH:quinone reductase-like Zn-dependent oxidoreductase
MLVLRQIGHGDPTTALLLADEPEPAPGPGEVVVAMEIAPLHGSELMNLRDPTRVPPTALPRIPGTEGVGRIVAKAADVTGFEIGQRVFPPKYSGLLRERVAVKAEQCYAAPGDCPAENLAIVYTMGLTAWLLLEDYAKLPAGSWIVHDAANSSIGRIIIALARGRGLRTVNVVRRPGLDTALKALGGDAVVVDPGNADDLARAVAAATNGAEICVGLDMIGGPLAGRIARCLAPGGTLVLYGGTGGAAAEIDFMDLHRRDLTVTGMGLSRAFNRRSAGEKAAIMAELGRLAARGVIATPIAAVYGLRDYRSAFAHLAREHAGKILIAFDRTRDAP